MNKAKFEEFEDKVKKTIKKYNLFTKKDNILVACSGGKDSTTLLYILNKLGYKVEAITTDASIGDYTKINVENLTKVCDKYKIKLHKVSFRDEFGSSLCYIRSTLNSKGIKLKSCTICGVLRRYIINKKARELKPTVIATGHNLDDEAQVTVMNLFRFNIEPMARLGPATGLIKDKKFVPRVKPLYFCSEDEVKKYSKTKNFPVNYKECPCRKDAYRKEIAEILDKHEKNDPNLKLNIVMSFLNILPDLKKSYASEEKIKYCKTCGEPSKGENCRTCMILQKLR